MYMHSYQVICNLLCNLLLEEQNTSECINKTEDTNSQILAWNPISRNKHGNKATRLLAKEALSELLTSPV